MRTEGREGSFRADAKSSPNKRHRAKKEKVSPQINTDYMDNHVLF